MFTMNRERFAAGGGRAQVINSARRREPSNRGSHDGCAPFAGIPAASRSTKPMDVRDFVDDGRDHHVTSHIAQNTTNGKSAIDARTPRHRGLCDAPGIKPWRAP